jgi:hypothetical protein
MTKHKRFMGLLSNVTDRAFDEGGIFQEASPTAASYLAVEPEPLEGPFSTSSSLPASWVKSWPPAKKPFRSVHQYR